MTRLTPPSSTTGPLHRPSASTAAGTTAPATTSGSPSGRRSKADAVGAGAASAGTSGAGVPVGSAAGVADHRLPGIACGADGFGLLEHQQLHRRSGAQVHHRQSGAGA